MTQRKNEEELNSLFRGDMSYPVTPGTMTRSVSGGNGGSDVVPVATNGKKDPHGYRGASLGKGFNKRPGDSKINTGSTGSYTPTPGAVSKKRKGLGAMPLNKNKRQYGAS